MIIFFQNVSKLSMKVGLFINIEKKKSRPYFMTPTIVRK